MNADTLFFVAIFVGLLEAVTQHFWSHWYFKLGIPILVASIPRFADLPTLKLKSVSFKRLDASTTLIRQKRYGIARYAYYHGYLQDSNYGSEMSTRCFLFVDWNVLAVGAFVACALLDYSLAAALFGAAVGLGIAAISIQLSRRTLLLGFAQEIALRK